MSPWRCVAGVSFGLWGLSLTALSLAPSTETRPASGATPLEPRPVASLPAPVVSFAIDLHHTQKLPLYHAAIDRIAGLGCNSLEVLTPVFQADARAPAVSAMTGPGRGPTREQLVSVLTHAERRGLRTVLMPIVLFTAPRGNEWRGRIQPEHWEAWWQSYETAILRFVDVANETDVDLFSVGSELLSTESQTRRWAHLTARVRDRFDGPIMYSTNWDHYHETKIWPLVDVIGVNGYWDLTTGGDDPASLTGRWRQIRDRLLAFARDRGRPLLLTEIGYPTLPWAVQDPWNYVPGARTTPAPNAQAAGYRAFLEAWRPVLDAPDPAPLLGVVFYRWDPYRSGGANDTGYGVAGKPALELLEGWMGERGKGGPNF